MNRFSVLDDDELNVDDASNVDDESNVIDETNVVDDIMNAHATYFDKYTSRGNSFFGFMWADISEIIVESVHSPGYIRGEDFDLILKIFRIMELVQSSLYDDNFNRQFCFFSKSTDGYTFKYDKFVFNIFYAIFIDESFDKEEYASIYDDIIEFHFFICSCIANRIRKFTNKNESSIYLEELNSISVDPNSNGDFEYRLFFNDIDRLLKSIHMKMYRSLIRCDKKNFIKKRCIKNHDNNVKLYTDCIIPLLHYDYFFMSFVKNELFCYNRDYHCMNNLVIFEDICNIKNKRFSGNNFPKPEIFCSNAIAVLLNISERNEDDYPQIDLQIITNILDSFLANADTIDKLFLEENDASYDDYIQDLEDELNESYSRLTDDIKDSIKDIDIIEEYNFRRDNNQLDLYDNEPAGEYKILFVKYHNEVHN